jgi:cytochrome oxidase Cu insertion factor (SCO1/SenC/PrrC family)
MTCILLRADWPRLPGRQSLLSISFCGSSIADRSMRRISIILIPVALTVALVLGFYIWRTGDDVPALGRIVQTGTAKIGGPFVLIDQNGVRRASSDFRGRFMLIYFGYSYCPDVCPTTLSLMAEALDKLGSRASQVVPVFITIDPERDTPAKLKPYMASFGPRFVGLTGDLADIKKVANLFRVYVKKVSLSSGGYAMEHSSVIYLMGPDGKFVTYWDDTSIGPDKLAAELRARL